MRRMDAPPVLEVEAPEVAWFLDTWVGDMGDASDCTLTDGVSRVSIRARELLMDNAEHLGDFPTDDPSLRLSPEEALFSILQSAPSTMRIVSLGLASWCDSNGSQQRHLVLHCGIDRPSRRVSDYQTAAQLAEGLQPLAVAARIKLEVDEQSQQVHLIRL